MTDLPGVLKDLSAADDYARGALDVLALLGLVTRAEDAARPAGDVAGMALDVLRAHLADGIAAGIDWDDLDAAPPRAVDFLRALEASRLRRVEHPTPARVVAAAQSIIKARRDGGDLYLMQFDRHGGRYQPVGGKRDPGETDLEMTLRREIFEELALAAIPGPDQLRLTPVGSGWKELAPSATYGVLTQYSFAFFLAGDIGFPIRVDQETRWLTRAEVIAARADDGRSISDIYLRGLGLELLDGLPLSLVL